MVSFKESSYMVFTSTYHYFLSRLTIWDCKWDPLCVILPLSCKIVFLAKHRKHELNNSIRSSSYFPWRKWGHNVPDLTLCSLCNSIISLARGYYNLRKFSEAFIIFKTLSNIVSMRSVLYMKSFIAKRVKRHFWHF